MSSEVYLKEIIVQEGDIDQLNHVNNVTYLKWVQEIAGEHWYSKNLKAIDENYYWVVIDHYIKYSGQAFLNETIIAKTFVENMNGVKSLRNVSFYKEDKLIVEAKTNWCFMDAKRNRPTRIPEEISKLFRSDK